MSAFPPVVKMRRSMPISEEKQLITLFKNNNNQLASAFIRIYGNEKPITAYFPDWQMLYELGQKYNLTNDQMSELHEQYTNMSGTSGGRRRKLRKRSSTKSKLRKTKGRKNRRRTKRRQRYVIKQYA